MLRVSVLLVLLAILLCSGLNLITQDGFETYSEFQVDIWLIFLRYAVAVVSFSAPTA